MKGRKKQCLGTNVKRITLNLLSALYRLKLVFHYAAQREHWALENIPVLQCVLPEGEEEGERAHLGKGPSFLLLSCCYELFIFNSIEHANESNWCLSFYHI